MASSRGPEEDARALLAEAVREEDRPRRHLLVAAALRAILGREPVVVGGAAQDFYTSGVYVETDLDMCGWVTAPERATLRLLGFEKQGRHWVYPPANVAAEFPESKIEGDEARIVRVPIGDGIAAIIGVDDLYLDRLRQATAEHEPAQQTHAARAIAFGNLESMDWPYVGSVLASTRRSDPALGRAMGEIHRAVREELGSLIDRGEL
ncbi:MAG: hypothetical protein WD096_11370 [Actinomycetota bacterium]